MCQKLAEKISWLLYFEHEWASDWILSHLLNQQVWDQNQKRRRNGDLSDDDDDDNDDGDVDGGNENQSEIAEQGMKTKKKSEDQYDI